MLPIAKQSAKPSPASSTITPFRGNSKSSLLAYNNVDLSRNPSFCDIDIRVFCGALSDINVVPCADAVNLAVVFDDLADQLDVMGRYVGGPEVELRSKTSVDYDRDTHRPTLRLPGIESRATSSRKTSLTEASAAAASTRDSKNRAEPRYLLKQNYEPALARRIWQGCFGPQTTLRRRLSYAVRMSYLNTLTSRGKLQMDRAFLQKSVQDLMIDIIQHSSFKSLVDVIEEDAAKKAEMHRLTTCNMTQKKQKEEYRKAIIQVKKEKVVESKKCDRELWALEDATQEILNRTDMEHKYMQATGRMVAARSSKQCRRRIQDQQRRLDEKKVEVATEYRVHTSMVGALTNRIQHLSDLEKYWSQKYEMDKEQLQIDLDLFKEDRARCLKKIAYLQKVISLYKPICVDDRRIKAIAEARRKRTELEHKKATRLQANWRGTMVRRLLGRFRPVDTKLLKRQKKKKKK